MAAIAELSPEQLKRCLDEAVAAAQEAGNLMLECFARNDALTCIEEKSNPVDLVTKYDRQVEDLVLKRLRTAFPDFGVVAEETASKEPLTDKPTWVLDPIDGTTNFIHKQAECCILIGLALHKKSVLGVCFIPKLDEMYTAVRGQGAYCNGRRIQTSKCQDLMQAMVNTHFTSYSRGRKVADRLMGVFQELMAYPVRALRAGGSAGVDMMHVARGRQDVYFEVGIHPWDICAGVIIVEEAGGICVDTLGGPLDLTSRRILVAASPTLGEQVAACLRKHSFASLDAADYEGPPDAKKARHGGD